MPFKNLCRLGTRKSALAKTQSQTIANLLNAGGLDCRLVEIISHGDIDRTNPLYSIETDSPGLFCKQLEEALLADAIDIAVHSLKDLPTNQPAGLSVAAVPKRERTHDCLIVHPSQIDETKPLRLKQGVRVGTSSLRREAQLLDCRPDLKIESLRGNVPSRVAQVRQQKLDAAVLAAAGLSRLGLDLEGLEVINLPARQFVPAPGQGALAIEIRAQAAQAIHRQVALLNDVETATAVRIERRIMKDLEGGCTLPFGALCEREGEGWHVSAFLGIARNRAEARRDWIGFHRFDISGSDEETLVAETVRYFRAKQDSG